MIITEIDYSIITFSKKKGKEMLPSTLDMEPSTLDTRQKDKEAGNQRVYLFVEGRGSRVPWRGRGFHVEGRG